MGKKKVYIKDKRKVSTTKVIGFVNLTPYNFKKTLLELKRDSLAFGNDGKVFDDLINETRSLQKRWKQANAKLKTVKSKSSIRKYQQQKNLITRILQDEFANLSKSNKNRINFRRTLKGGKLSYKYDKQTMDYLNYANKSKFEYMFDSLGPGFLTGEENDTPGYFRRKEQLIRSFFGDIETYEMELEKYKSYINNNPKEHPEASKVEKQLRK